MQKRKTKAQKATEQAERKRAFTSADIKAFYEKHWTNEDVFIYELQSIQLLPDLMPPTWRVEHTIRFRGGMATPCTLLLYQRTLSDGSIHIDLPGTVTLPSGCATVEAEDAEIQRLQQERLAKRHQERKEEVGI